MIKKIIYILLLTFLTFNLKAQDTYYSQFFANKLDLNPAFAGSQYYHRVIMNYRNQWASLGNPYVTYSVSYDRYINGFGGVGLQVMQDRQADGAQVTTAIKGIYSYLIKLNQNSAIRLALSGAFMKNQLDASKLIFPDMIDPRNPGSGSHDSSYDPVVTVKDDVDVSFGLLAHTGKYTFGFSAQHLARPSVSFTQYSEVPYKFVAHFGAEFPITSNGLHPVHFNVSPLFMFQKQGENMQMNYGLYSSRNNLVAGMWFRQNFNLHYDSMIFMFGFDNKLFRLAYSYDHAFNYLSDVGSGVHEISFIFLMGEKKSKKRYRQIPCPKFFRKMNIIEM